MDVPPVAHHHAPVPAAVSTAGAGHRYRSPANHHHLSPGAPATAAHPPPPPPPPGHLSMMAAAHGVNMMAAHAMPFRAPFGAMFPGINQERLRNHMLAGLLPKQNAMMMPQMMQISAQNMTSPLPNTAAAMNAAAAAAAVAEQAAVAACAVARFQAPMPYPAFMFTQEDLDMVLYGYARPKTGENLAGHALSGLRISELSYGMDRILGSPLPVPSVKGQTPAGPIDPSTLDLPDGIELMQTTFAGTTHVGIFCRKTVVAKGTRFGPFQGKVVNTSEIKTNDDNSHMWEIFQDGQLSHYIDGRGSSGNWMAFVNCARYAQEQNLIAIQEEGEIYYEACKDVGQGTELLVWYGDSYLQFMGIPVALKEMADGAMQQELESSEGYQCERCGKVFAYKYYRDKHLKYTRCVDQGDRKFPCHLCSRSFEKRDRLRIHILHVHEKHRPHKCTVCAKAFSQSSSLNKHMRVHSGERPYKCVYCSKAFTASSILRTHIRQHSGEKPFKCKHCGKAFASHAAHDSHVRRTHTKERPCVCHICSKAFSQPYELKFHMNVHAGAGPHICRECGHGFCSDTALENHRLTHDCTAHAPRVSMTPNDVIASYHHLPSSGTNYHDINMNDKIRDDPIDVVNVGPTAFPGLA